MILIVDSGSTKSDWIAIDSKKGTHFFEKQRTKGLNPAIISEQEAHEIVNENIDFASKLQLKLIGNIDYSVHNSIQDFNLEKYVKRFDYLSHNKVISHQKSSKVLLLMVNNTPSYLEVNVTPGAIVDSGNQKVQRVIKSLRLIRLIRIIKLYKYIVQSKTKNDNEDKGTKKKKKKKQI